MNFALIEGVVEGSGASGLWPWLEPGPGHCIVAVGPAAPAGSGPPSLVVSALWKVRMMRLFLFRDARRVRGRRFEGLRGWTGERLKSVRPSTSVPSTKFSYLDPVIQ